MSRSSRARDLQRQAEALGFQLVRTTAKGHLVYQHPAVKQQVVTPGSAGDVRGPKNAVSLMRRLLRQAGID
jgi:predicted RNA binding protein YcfA (HicA-like mRNA interferase family)